MSSFFCPDLLIVRIQACETTICLDNFYNRERKKERKKERKNGRKKKKTVENLHESRSTVYTQPFLFIIQYVHCSIYKR